MAMIRMEPTIVRVRADWFNGRPREITWGEERLPIMALAAVRHEDFGLSRRDRAADALRGRDARGRGWP